VTISGLFYTFAEINVPKINFLIPNTFKLNIMKKKLFIIMLFIAGIILSSCSKKSATLTTPTSPNWTQGKYTATGLITLTSGGVNYSMPMANVQVVTTDTYSVILNALDSTLVTNFGTIVLQINSPTSAGLTTGTYKIPSTTNFNLINFMDKTLTEYTASPSVSGTSATINITTLTATSIQGTFSATLVPLENHSGTSVTITNGVINCTY
jgi:hypothetical protein